jgi:hypothetical protein
MNRRVLLALVLALSFFAPTPFAFSGQKKTVHVKEYTKKDGTTVAAHERKAPEKKTAEATPTASAPTTTTKAAAAAAPKQDTARAAASIPPSASTITRDEKGRIQRSAAARHAFARSTGYPNGRPGYVIDHIFPLACGGVDTPANMQWQTIAEGKAKDRTERVGCR